MRGWSRQRVGHFKEDGRLVLNAEGLVDVAASDAKLAATLDRSRAHRDRQLTAPLVTAPTAQLPLAEPARQQKPSASSEDVEDYWEHKARREKIEADRAELAYQKALGQVVDADEVRRSRRETAHRVANALQLLPAKLAPVVAPQDPLRAQQALADEMERVLLELAGDLDGMPQGNQGASVANHRAETVMDGATR
jgi:hypothetical protein